MNEDEQMIVPEPETIEETDRLKLVVAKLERERAIAQHETAEAKYRCAVLEIYVKYGLTPKDQMREDGVILRTK